MAASARRSFAAVRHALDTGSLSVAAETARCRASIDAANERLRCVTATRPQADVARNVEWAERLIKAGKSTGVCGIPVCVKDCFHIGGMETSNGTENGVDGLPDRDAAAVAALMEAGAIVVAKTNLPAHSMDVQTFNDRYGVTGTPYNVDFAAGGSSGGSAAAVGAGVCDLAVGTDLAGSLRIPASFCGVYSLRPSHGLVPWDGALPPMELPAEAIGSGAVAGPIGSDISALVAFMNAMGVESDTELDQQQGLGRVAVTPALDGLQTSQLVQDAVSCVADCAERCMGGALAVNPLPGPLLRRLGRAHADFCSLWLPNTKPAKDDAVQAAVETRTEAREAIDAVLDEHCVWVLPVIATPTFKHNLTLGDINIDGKDVPYWRAMISYVTPLTVTGHPVVTMPVGLFGEDKLPIGVQVVGKRGEDMALLRACASLAVDLPPLPPPSGDLSVWVGP